MTMPFLLRFLPVLAILSLARLAHAQPAPASGAAPPPPPAPIPPSVPHPFAYGILVGTNTGGPGQTELRYAEDDARRVAAVLRELGRYGTTDMRVFVRPDAAKVLAAVDEVAKKLEEHRSRGEQAVFVFYYSGHAKANAFSLGADELPIATLREKLRALPTQLTLVVLDACQSGQFARVKGAEPAADFSFNSVARLGTKGVAVIASSSGQELSQESDELRSSFFTHHFIVGLRGAADSDGDGKVSLDEAYRYAYRRTLAATAQTKVGGQHVTLETDLAGQGDVPVTYPAAARSQLELPSALDARVLVQHRASGNIVAEVQKAPGSAVKLAFAEGAYDAIVRQNAPPRAVMKCALTLADARLTTLDTDRCDLVAASGGGLVKGDDEDRPAPPLPADVAPWQIELGFGPMWRTTDAYTRRLGEFGYQSQVELSPRFRFHVGITKGLLPHLSIGVAAHTLEGAEYDRSLSDSRDKFQYDAYGLSAFVRASTLPFGRISGGLPFGELYAQGGIGVALGVTQLTTGATTTASTEDTTETYWGFVVGGQAGAAISLGRRLAFFAQGGYEYAPAITNLLGDTHDSGGPSAELGLRLRFE